MKPFNQADSLIIDNPYGGNPTSVTAIRSIDDNGSLRAVDIPGSRPYFIIQFFWLPYPSQIPALGVIATDGEAYEWVDAYPVHHDGTRRVYQSTTELGKHDQQLIKEAIARYVHHEGLEV